MEGVSESWEKELAECEKKRMELEDRCFAGMDSDLPTFILGWCLDGWVIAGPASIPVEFSVDYIARGSGFK